ncbi:MAG: hypothetical protein RR382_05250 [Tannerellaceae bacterium]
MNNNLYREKSLEQLNAPQKMDAYLKVNHISGWIILLAVILILIGCAVWALATNIDGQTVFELLFNSK